MKAQSLLLRIILFIIGMPIILIVGLLLYGGVLRIAGYHVDMPGWQVAKIAAERGDPAECKKIWKVFSILGPQTAEQINGCYLDYAKLTLDPSICAFLMPSDYGLYCLASVSTEANKNRDQFYMLEKTSELEYMHEGISKKFKFPQIIHCQEYTNILLRDTCYIQRTAKLPNVDECDRVSLPRRHSCPQAMAIKLKDISYCEKIHDEWERKSCRTQISLWHKYPDYRCKLIDDPECKSE